jgi:hypothetical protein
MAHPEKREKARELRRQGWQLVDVAKELEVSYGTVRQWCRDIELTDEQVESLYDKDPLLFNQHKGAQTNKRNALHQRLKYQEAGRQQTAKGSLIHLMGCMLYWGEGSKHRQQLKFTNTDPNMLILFARFLREEMAVPDSKFVLHILTHSNDENEREQIRRYWLAQLSLADDCKVMFTLKVGTDSRKARYPNGICAICIYSTEVVQRVFGAIQEYIGFVNPKWVE